ncbi:hypothetical protein TYRP_013763 [Tyrophagus putrescentiae]|nr:hypothetical protein TYRP_013763 [Tyrophagus putrescentiae]
MPLTRLENVRVGVVLADTTRGVALARGLAGLSTTSVSVAAKLLNGGRNFGRRWNGRDGQVSGTEISCGRRLLSFFVLKKGKLRLASIANRRRKGRHVGRISGGGGGGGNIGLRALPQEVVNVDVVGEALIGGGGPRKHLVTRGEALLLLLLPAVRPAQVLPWNVLLVMVVISGEKVALAVVLILPFFFLLVGGDRVVDVVGVVAVVGILIVLIFVVDLATSPPPICCSGPLNLRCSRDIDLRDSLLEMPTAAEEEAEEAEEAAETAARMLSLLLLFCLLGAEGTAAADDVAALPNCGFLGGVELELEVMPFRKLTANLALLSSRLSSAARACCRRRASAASSVLAGSVKGGAGESG